MLSFKSHLRWNQTELSPSESKLHLSAIDCVWVVYLEVDDLEHLRLKNKKQKQNGSETSYLESDERI